MEMHRAKSWKTLVTYASIGLMLFGSTLTKAQTLSGLPSVAADTLPALHNEITTHFTVSQLKRYEQALARELAMLLSNPQVLAQVKTSLTETAPRMPLVAFLQQVTSATPSPASEQLRRFVTSLDLQVRRAKRIETRLDALLEVRLAHPSMAAALQHDTPPLVLALPRADERSLTTLEAFDVSGHPVVLDAWHAPAQPVLVVGIDAKADLQAFIELSNAELRMAGLQSAPLLAAAHSVTRLTKYYMRDDHEPFFKGDAEIYAVVSGVNAGMTGPQVYFMALPSLDNDGQTYGLRVPLINWANFAHGVANIEFMEGDSGWDFGYLLGVLGAGLGVLIGDISFSSAQAGWKVGEAVHQGLSKIGWDLVDDDDYVDRFPEIRQETTYRDLAGHDNDVRIDLVHRECTDGQTRRRGCPQGATGYMKDRCTNGFWELLHNFCEPVCGPIAC